ncbi:hypothetical protein P152DRAFT_459146 [Eremomyces bilateralis CBS 781.70]|uniref:Transcription initiation factor TFIID subunit 4 n=1 Tax=Eremomyces bilateralis CBS 781.70 TaxID=1392243 RepID=A0A6G1G0P0_9PEZI|nr:uncharacterized protein P152DRAFT_459146 [Eremomyces bilateralis CBS 781.70]KAF1811677.1 hypothetical protein P152DRAFT_459146 [Eremomyces bilateralis CBS 781.70]
MATSMMSPGSMPPPNSVGPPNHMPPPNSMPPPGSMPPPQRPAEKTEKEKRSATDINDLSDIVTAAGVDIRAEEAALAQTYRSASDLASQQINGSFVSNSQSTASFSPNQSFGYPQGSFTSYPPFPASGAASQSPVAPKTVEEELFEKHKKAARDHAERKQFHLNNPFLSTNCLRQKLDKHTRSNGVRLNVDGLYDQSPQTPQGVNAMRMTGRDGMGFVAAKASSVVEHNAAFADVLALVSLAANERLRGLVEDAYALSRGRRVGADGVVPPDFQDLATGTGDPKPISAVPQSITNSPWDMPPDSAVSPMTVPQKDPLDASNRLPTPPTEPPSTPVSTQSYPPTLAITLDSMYDRDLAYEQARVETRRKRRKLAAETAASQSVSAAESPAPGTPSSAGGPIDGKAPDLIPPMKMTKKEREKLAKSSATEEVQHRAANTTASMALGGLGKKKYSWMTSGTPVTKPLPNMRVNTSLSGSKSTGAAGGGAQGPPPVDRLLQAVHQKKLGEWKEDSEKGRGIQLRDWIAALEMDGREKKGMVRAAVKRNFDKLEEQDNGPRK